MKVETYSQAELGPALALRVAADLRQAIEDGRRASVAVPGGSTPGAFLAALARENIDWSKVAITLTDERCVPFDDPRSNHRLVAQTLLLGRARAATFVPLHGPDRTIAVVGRALAETVLPLHVCVLGMGDDMHTASLFPGMPGLARLLSPDADANAARVDPPGAEAARVTLTAPALTAARHTYVLIKGRGKRDALGRAMRTEDPLAAPVRAILDAARAPVIYYAE